MKQKTAKNALFAWLMLCTMLASTAISAADRTILVLGDSISAGYGIAKEAGWVNLLQQRLDEQYPGLYRVVNASISGDTTAGGLRRLPDLLAKHRPRQVIVELGGNDGLRAMPLPAMASNLEEIIRLSRAEGAKVLMMSVQLPASYGLFFNRRFSQVYDQVEKKLDVARVDLGFGQLNDRNLLQEDGIHPTAAAQPLLLDWVWPELNRVLPNADN